MNNRLYLTDTFPIENFEKGLKQFRKKDIAKYAAILYKYYVMKEGNLDYSDLPDKMLKFLSS